LRLPMPQVVIRDWLPLLAPSTLPHMSRLPDREAWVDGGMGAGVQDPERPRSNQGSYEIDRVLDDVRAVDLKSAAEVGWAEVRNHPTAPVSCECPAIEILARLYELGYRLTKDQA